MTVSSKLLRQWYAQLHFPSRYDAAFNALLTEPETAIQPEFGDNAQANLLTALYKCDLLAQEYAARGIDRTVLLDTLSDVVIWTNIWYDVSGELGLMEVGWLGGHHFAGRLFRLGRLQFCMGHSAHAIADADIAEGAPILEVHIPAGEPMLLAACQASVEQARVFFAKYFPSFAYEGFTCHSWLLDRSLKQFLGEQSNILQFQTMFHIVHDDPSDVTLKYIFRWDATRDKLGDYEPASKLAAAIKPYVLAGGTLYESLGWFK